MAKYTYEFVYMEDNHRILCVVENKGNKETFIGVAQCHPSDYDFENKRTGEHIAYLRAMIEALEWEKKLAIDKINTVKELASYNGHYDVYNCDDEIYWYHRHIEEQVFYLRQKIKSLKKELSAVIAGKNELYEKLRKRKEKDG